MSPLLPADTAGYCVRLVMDGILLIDKPSGPTSAAIVRLVKARLGRKARVGHLGTLDPFATGVLPILIGEGTKLAPFLQQNEKEYTGVIALGSTTDTLDRTGAVIATKPAPALDAAKLAEAAARFTGPIMQVPPVFSAIKRGGVPLYKLARRGLEVEAPPPREVEIKRLELELCSPDTIRFVVESSSGMYVRSLARDLGEALGTVAHLAALTRMRNGEFAIEQAAQLDTALDALERGDHSCVLGLREAAARLAEVRVDAGAEQALRHGDSRVLDGCAPAGVGYFKVVAQERLVAIAEPVTRVTARVVRVFNLE